MMRLVVTLGVGALLRGCSSDDCAFHGQSKRT